MSLDTGMPTSESLNDVIVNITFSIELVTDIEINDLIFLLEPTIE